MKPDRPMSDEIIDGLLGPPRERTPGEQLYSLLAELTEGARRMQSLLSPKSAAQPYGDAIATFGVCQLVIIEAEVAAISSGDIRPFEELRALLVKWAGSMLPPNAAKRIANAAAYALDNITAARRAVADKPTYGPSNLRETLKKAPEPTTAGDKPRWPADPKTDLNRDEGQGG